MSEEIERLLVRVEANAAQFEGQMKRINKALYGSANEVRRTRQQFKREMQDLGRDVYVPVQAASALALGAITAFSYQAAKRAEAVGGAFEQTFRDMPDEARKAVEAIAGDFGRLETDIKDNFTQLRSVMTALGVDAETSLSIVDQLQRRSLDIAAFKDVSDADAFRAVISGITGETEPLKRFGVVVNETAVKAELVRLGFKGASTSASEAAKVIARTNIILRQSAEMQGQVAREADTLAEKEKRARTEFIKAAEDLGQRFLPIAADVLEWAVDALDAFNNLPTGVQNAGLALLALVAASGPIGAAIKGLQALIKAAVAARLALAAVGGSAAAGGAAGAAARGGAAGFLAGAAPLAAGAAVVGVGVGSMAPAPPRANAPLDDRLAYERRARDRIDPNAPLFAGDKARERRALAAANQRVAALERQVAERDRAAAARSEASAQAEAGVTGDFGLSEAQKHSTGVATGGGRRGGSRADNSGRIAEARAALDLERAIAAARATGDEAAVRAAEEREELARLIQQYTDAGSTDAQSEAMSHLALLNQATALAEERERAEEQVDLILKGRENQLEREAEYQQVIYDQLMDQLGMQEAIARARGDEGAMRNAERELWIASRVNELLGRKLALTREEASIRAGGEFDDLEAADAEGRFRDLVVAAGEDFGGLAEEAGERFKRRALEGLADQIWKLVSQIDFAGGAGGGQGGNLGNAIMQGMNFLFGRRASGGPVQGGKPYLVGENGPEVVVPSVNGNVLNSVRAAGQSGPASRLGAAPVVFDLRGAVVTRELLEQINRISAARAGQAEAAAYARASADIPARLAHDRKYTRK